MPRNQVVRVVRVLATLVLLAVAVVGYVLWIPMQRPSRAALARLVVTTPVHGFKAAPSVAAPSASSSAISVLKTAAKQTPGETGVYSVDWKGTKAKSSASLVVAVLPTLALAKSAQQEANKEFTAQDALTGDGYGYGGAITDASVPGARGAYFLPGTTPTLKPTGKRADLLVFRLQRVIGLVSVAGTGAASSVAASAVATAEYDHLSTVGASPRVAKTVFPLVATIVYAGVALVALAVLEASPSAVAAARRRRHAAAEAAVRRDRAARGAKITTRSRRPVGAGRGHGRH